MSRQVNKKENDEQTPERKIEKKSYNDILEYVRKEISKMKTGSVALVNQITTISKIRIYNPLHSKDVLGNIKVSNEILDAIDDKIKELYLGK